MSSDAANNSLVLGASADEGALVAKCQAGDRTAIQQLFRLHYDRVRRVLARFSGRGLGGGTELDDLIQETFLQVFTSLPKFRGQSKLSTWIYRITTNVALAHFRQQGRRAELMEVFVAQSEAFQHTPGNPERDVIRKQRSERVQVLLMQLSPKRRMALILRDGEGLDPGEIAEVLRVPRVTVRTRLYHARRDFLRVAREANL